jgi:hypothetical protein
MPYIIMCRFNLILWTCHGNRNGGSERLPRPSGNIQPFRIAFGAHLGYPERAAGALHRRRLGRAGQQARAGPDQVPRVTIVASMLRQAHPASTARTVNSIHGLTTSERFRTGLRLRDTSAPRVSTALRTADISMDPHNMHAILPCDRVAPGNADAETMRHLRARVRGKCEVVPRLRGPLSRAGTAPCRSGGPLCLAPSGAGRADEPGGILGRRDAQPDQAAISGARRRTLCPGALHEAPVALGQLSSPRRFMFWRRQ